MSLEQLKTIRSRRMEQRFVELQEQRRVLQERAELAEAHQGLQAAEAQVQTAQQNSSEANLKLEKLKEIIKVQGAKSAREEPVQ